MNNKNGNKGGLTMLAVAILGLTLVGGLFVAPTGSQAAPAYAVPQPHVVSIPANGTVTLKARGFCMAFGKPFPTGQMVPNGLTNATLRGALTYAIDKGYADGNAQQVQLAVWNLIDKTWHDANHVIGSEIASNTTATPPTASALALTDAMTQKSVDVSAKFVPQTADAFYGDGNVVVTNTTSAALNVYMPIGVVFTVPNANGQFQDLLSYELAQAEGTPTAGATRTDPTSTPQATVTTAPTAQATATVQVSTPVATATTEVSTPVATATTEVAPTVEVATATPAPSTSTLPQTGNGDGGAGLLVALAIALAMSALGLVLRLRKA